MKTRGAPPCSQKGIGHPLYPCSRGLDDCAVLEHGTTPRSTGPATSSMTSRSVGTLWLLVALGPRRARCGADLRPGTPGLRLSLPRPRIQLSGPAADPDHGLPGRCAHGVGERQGGGAPAWQELLRRDLGGYDRGADRRRLPGDRAGPDRLLQVSQAAFLPVHVPGACPQHPRACCTRSASTMRSSSDTPPGACWRSATP